MFGSLHLSFVLLFLLIFLLVFFKFLQPGRGSTHSAPGDSALSYDFRNPDSVLTKGKKILILAPHEDDEALMCSGVIAHAVANGADVRVGVISNGDKKGRKVGLTRIRETIKAMEYLGLSPANIIFFGYGDTEKDSNSFMSRLYNAATDTTIISSHVGNQTYSVPEAPEYHFQKYGVHGPYDRMTFRQDLESAIQEYSPDYIFVTSLYDAHPDHSALYRFTLESVITIKRNNSKFFPVMYEYLVHAHDGDDYWPARDPGRSPPAPFSKPATWDANTLLDWEKRESFTLPLDMQKVPRSKSKKYITISKYGSQRPSRNNQYLYSYVKSDEIFWKKDFSNIAFLASVAVSSENVATGQLGLKAVDGIADGYPRFPANEWATMGETAGAWIQLSWPRAYTINRIILYDRPNPDDNITGATLTFSDGSSLEVGPLPNNGRGYEISFAPKTVEWVKLAVDTAIGENTGLSEFEVYEVPELRLPPEY